ncbi:MAG TPA: hypothetical protein VK469_12990 [Candidatus Kapabacteria bacterium]|nr:hypothetical protein [Candidatus Kapabacteria bacterium]
MQRMKQMRLDPELVAMNRVSEVLKYLGHGQRRRVINWAKARFNLIDEPPAEVAAAEIPVKSETPAAPSTEPTSAAQPTPNTPDTQAMPAAPSLGSEAEPESQFREIKLGETKTKLMGVKNKGDESKIFADFDTIEDLFLMANAKKISHRILLVAAYLQEKGNLDEVSSLDINSYLKKLGYGVSNITTLINGLLKKTPPQIIVTKKEGDTKQSRRKFRVTERGFKDAESFIKNTDNN